MGPVINNVSMSLDGYMRTRRAGGTRCSPRTARRVSRGRATPRSPAAPPTARVRATWSQVGAVVVRGREQAPDAGQDRGVCGYGTEHTDQLSRPSGPAPVSRAPAPAPPLAGPRPRRSKMMVGCPARTALYVKVPISTPLPPPGSATMGSPGVCSTSGRSACHQHERGQVADRQTPLESPCRARGSPRDDSRSARAWRRLC